MSTVTHPARPTAVVALQYTVPTRMVTIPLGILLAVVVVMAVVTGLIVRGGGSAQDLDYNGAVIYSLFGFVVTVGVQSVSATFPLALGLGATRRTFTAGTLVTAVAESLLLAVAALLLLGLERLSGGWFVGARVLRDSTLGGGDPLLLAATMAGLSLTALTVGGLYGAAYVRFGARGPAAVGIASTVVALVALLLFLPEIAAAAEALGGWSFVVAGLVLVTVSTIGEYLLLRRASVR